MSGGMTFGSGCVIGHVIADGSGVRHPGSHGACTSVSPAVESSHEVVEGPLRGEFRQASMFNLPD